MLTRFAWWFTLSTLLSWSQTLLQCTERLTSKVRPSLPAKSCSGRGRGACCKARCTHTAECEERVRTDRNAIDNHDFRSAMIWILSEDGIKFSPHFPETVFVWIKMHRNGTIYCPYETMTEQTATSHKHDLDLNGGSAEDESKIRPGLTHDRCLSMCVRVCHASAHASAQCIFATSESVQ